MGTLPISPTLYQVHPGQKYYELMVTPTWCNPDAMDRGYTSFFSYQLGGSLLVGFNAKTMVADTYVLEGASQGLSKQKSAKLKAPYSLFSVGPLGGNQVVMGYDPTSGNFDFYTIGQDLSLNELYSYKGEKGLTFAGLFTYHGALYFMDYNEKSGQANHYQVIDGHGHIEVEKIWSGTVAKGWSRLALFQMCMENFVFNARPKNGHAAIEHIMDNPGEGHIAVSDDLPVARDANDLKPFYFEDDSYIVTYKAKDGVVTINRLDSDGQGLVENSNFKTFTDGVAVTPMYKENDSFLLFY